MLRLAEISCSPMKFLAPLSTCVQTQLLVPHVNFAWLEYILMKERLTLLFIYVIFQLKIQAHHRHLLGFKINLFCDVQQSKPHSLKGTQS